MASPTMRLSSMDEKAHHAATETTRSRGEARMKCSGTNVPSGRRVPVAVQSGTQPQGEVHGRDGTFVNMLSIE